MANLPAQSERIRVPVFCRRGVPLLRTEVRQTMKREALARAVPDLAGDREVPLVVLPRLPDAAEAPEDVAEVPRGARLALSVPDLPGEREGPLEVLPRLRETS